MRMVIYMGFNNPRTYKRGVENVIMTQAMAVGKARKFYLFFDEHASVFRWSGIVCIGIPKGPMRFVRLNGVVARLIKLAARRRDHAIFHSHNYLMSLFLLQRTDLFTVHDGFWYLKKCFKSPLPWLFWVIERIVYRRTTRIHCNSCFTFAASQLPAVKKKADVIYCTTPLEQCVADMGMQRSVEGRSTVLVIRSIEERARIDLVIEVAALAQKQGLAIDLVVAGKGPLLAHYREIVKDLALSNIKLAGFIPDSELAARYRDCTCVLLTCENGEGFGLPIIEGYLFGKPVVASNRCAIPEVIVDPHYLSANDGAAILATLLSTITEQRDPDYFRQHYANNFSNKVISSQFSRLYDEVFPTAWELEL